MFALRILHEPDIWTPRVISPKTPAKAETASTFDTAAERLGGRRVLEVLARSDLLRGVPDGPLEQLAAHCMEQRAYRGEALIEEGDPAGDVLIIVSGRLEVHIESISPFVEIGLMRLGPGETAGEMALLEDEPRCASVVAIEPSQVFRIPADVLRGLAEEDAAFGCLLHKNLSRQLGRRLKAMNRRLVNIMRARSFVE